MTVLEDMRALASAIKFALKGMYGDSAPEFFLVLVKYGNDDTATCNTITDIRDPQHVRKIGQHLIDMADTEEPSLDPYSDTDVRGHA